MEILTREMVLAEPAGPTLDVLAISGTRKTQTLR